MKKPALVIMAAGMGSRYGGLKQIDPVGPNGEIIMEYSIYDALKAGFGKVIFIIKREMEATFRETVGSKVEDWAETAYVYQELGNVPPGFSVPEDRKKPWGTGHAVLCCKETVDTPFAVINADDFYGPSSFRVLHDELKDAYDGDGRQRYCMVGFHLENTLTENGAVARGICTVDAQGFLQAIVERTRIEKFGAAAKYTRDGEIWTEIPQGSTVSMNTWGFTPGIFTELELRFRRFLKENGENLQKAEFFLPSAVGELIAEGKAEVKVLPTAERWYGVTYREDKPVVKQAIGDLIRRGVYPPALWEK